jgi:hypothetical protein
MTDINPDIKAKQRAVVKTDCNYKADKVSRRSTERPTRRQEGRQKGQQGVKKVDRETDKALRKLTERPTRCQEG